MTWKNYLIFKRSIKLSIFQVFVPIFICLLLLGLNALLKVYSDQQTIRNPTIYTLSNLPRCMYPDDCLTIGYGVAGNIKDNEKSYQKVKKIVEYIADFNNLTINKDIKEVTNSTAGEFLNYISNNVNKTMYGIVFCLDRMDYFNTTIPCSFSIEDKEFNLYNIFYNLSNIDSGFLGSFSAPLPTDKNLLQLKLSVDNAYLAYYASLQNIKAPKITISAQAFPSAENRLMQGADIVGSYGPFYFFFPPIITFVIILLEIVREKDLKLRKV